MKQARIQSQNRSDQPDNRKPQFATIRQLWFPALVFLVASSAIVMAVALKPRKDLADAASPAAVIRTPPVALASPTPPTTNPGYPTLDELLKMSSEQLAQVDIAVVNLRCAEGLPGAEKIDIPAALQRIDRWAAWVKQQTRLHADKANDPERYDGVAGKYEMDMLTTVLQQDEGLRYDPVMIALQGKEGTPEDTFYDDAKNIFITGLTEKQTGTCSSMPVLYAAIARRLGYPVKLAAAAEHLYLQWEGKGSKFNIEATSTGGLNSESDEHYWHWPHPISPAAAEKYHYFQPLTPRDELAEFLSMRAGALMTAGNMLGSIRCQKQAIQVAEHNQSGMNANLDILQRAMVTRQKEQLDALLEKRDRQRALSPFGLLQNAPLKP